MHISLQDMLAIVAAILGPIVTLVGFMWHHFNSKFEKLDGKIDNLKAEINSLEKRLTENLGEKIDAVRDRVSRIEGQLAPASIVSLNPTKNKAS